MTDAQGDVWRRTTIECGPLRIVREYRHAPAAPPYPFYVPARARAGGGWRAAGVLSVMLAVSAGGLSVAATRAPAPRAPGYSVSVAVPQRVIAPAAPVRAAPRLVRAPEAVPVAAGTPAAARATPGDAGGRAAAIAAALHSGEVQEWFEAEAQVHGFVVAGEAERDGARTCRALSVLTRAPGGADRVEQQRGCLPLG